VIRAISQAIRHPGALYRTCRWALSYERLLQDAHARPGAALGRMFDATGMAFIHIPKTAGTSVADALYGRTTGHLTWAELHRADPEGFARWLTFAIVRDPVDRFLSAYDYLVRGAPAETNRAFRRRFLQRGCSAAAFIDAELRPPWRRAQILKWVHFRPQREFVVDTTGTLMVRRLIPFDRFDDVLPALLPAGTRLPRLNLTPGSRTTRAALPREALELLLEIYRDDVALLHLAHAAGGTDVYGRSLASAVAPDEAVAAPG
jgi:hypothetical protein